MNRRELESQLQELFEGLLANAADFRDFLAMQEDAFFELAANYQDLSGNLFTQFHAEMILHCLQHSTYHRGQIVTMARSLRGLREWIAVATSSLPTPVSPVMRTVDEVGATSSIPRKTSRIAWLRPII